MINFGEITKQELIGILLEYNKYIQEANDENRYKEGWLPVCIDEFYDCEYQELKNNIPTDGFLKDLPIGTRFYVINGAWNGLIDETVKDNKKCLIVLEQGEVMPIKNQTYSTQNNDHADLYIKID